MSAKSPVPGLVVRPAGPSDVDFVVETIIAAEKSGTDRLSYCTLFGLDEPEFRRLLTEMLDEDIPGQELCLDGYLVAEVNGQPAGAACAWVEGKGSKSSAIIKGSLLAHALGRERIMASASRLERVVPLTMARETDALQIESVYVAAPWRGRGIVRAIIDAHLRRAGADASGPSKCQIIVAASNDVAISGYRNCGFDVTTTRSSDDPSLALLLPATSRVLMERKLA